MSKIKNTLPDKLFGLDVGILLVWAIPVSVITILVFVFMGLVVPRFEQISTLWGQIDKVTKETKVLNDKRIYLLSLDQADLKAKSALVESGVLSEKNSYLLIKIVSKVVADFGYQVGDFSVSLGDVKQIDQKSTTFAYQKVPVEVSLTGPKDNFLKMVFAIENSLPVLSIDEFSMTSIGEVATIKMNVSAYYLPDWTQNKLESLSVTDLTPNKDESSVLSKIGSYKYYGGTEGQIGGSVGKFVPIERADPFY